jgi:hypothetical protein
MPDEGRGGTPGPAWTVATAAGRAGTVQARLTPAAG